MMIKNYLNTSDIEPDDFNILRFAESYQLETKHLLFIRNVAEQELGIKISQGVFSLWPYFDQQTDVKKSCFAWFIYRGLFGEIDLWRNVSWRN